MDSFLTINGVAFPTPRRGLNYQIATIVDSARNANGVVVGQKVGRDQQKINDLEWGYLTAAQVAQMFSVFDQNFFVTVKYPNPLGGWTTRKMYPGNRECEPFHRDPNSGLIKDYINIKVNLIDVGE